jgi:hypothetical protein
VPVLPHIGIPSHGRCGAIWPGKELGDDFEGMPVVVAVLVEEDVGRIDHTKVGVVFTSVEVGAEPGRDGADEVSGDCEGVADVFAKEDNFSPWDVFDVAGIYMLACEIYKAWCEQGIKQT